MLDKLKYSYSSPKLFVLAGSKDSRSVPKVTQLRSRDLVVSKKIDPHKDDPAGRLYYNSE